MKGSMSNGISKPDKESKTSMLNRLIRWKGLMLIIHKEIYSILLPVVKSLFGISKYKLCLRKMHLNINGMYWILLKYGHIKTIHYKM
jgi:hypothetical protein